MLGWDRVREGSVAKEAAKGGMVTLRSTARTAQGFHRLGDTSDGAVVVLVPSGGGYIADRSLFGLPEETTEFPLARCHLYKRDAALAKAVKAYVEDKTGMNLALRQPRWLSKELSPLVCTNPSALDTVRIAAMPAEKRRDVLLENETDSVLRHPSITLAVLVNDGPFRLERRRGRLGVVSDSLHMLLLLKRRGLLQREGPPFTALDLQGFRGLPCDPGTSRLDWWASVTLLFEENWNRDEQGGLVPIREGPLLMGPIHRLWQSWLIATSVRIVEENLDDLHPALQNIYGYARSIPSDVGERVREQMREWVPACFWNWLENETLDNRGRFETTALAKACDEAFPGVLRDFEALILDSIRSDGPARSKRRPSTNEKVEERTKAVAYTLHKGRKVYPVRCRKCEKCPYHGDTFECAEQLGVDLDALPKNEYGDPDPSTADMAIAAATTPKTSAATSATKKRKGSFM